MKIALCVVLPLLAGGSLAAELTTNSIGMVMVSIRSGEFIMGRNGTREESPEHRVGITKPFEMGATEVTRGQWKTVMGADAPDLGLGAVDDTHPVVGVTWFDAVDFCRKLSAMEGKTYRLPTEAEWEYACRAGTSTDFAFGKQLSLGNAHCEAYSPFQKPKGMERAPDPANKSTRPAGSRHANAWGLFDMHGNAQEWCYDYFDGEHYVGDVIARYVASVPEDERAAKSYESLAKVSEEMKGIWPEATPTGDERSRKVEADRLPAALKLVASDPLGPDHGNSGKRVVRGGCWRSGPPDCTSSARKGADPLWRNNTIGFRVVREDADGSSKSMTLPSAPGEVDLPGFGKLPEAIVNCVGMRLNLVRPGKVTMGTYDRIAIGYPPSAINGRSSVPRHEEEVKEPFYMAITHHTRAQRALCDQPAPYEWERLSTAPWYDGMDAALWLSEKDGRLYRFPTVVEFEHAQRAGTTTTWWWGDDWKLLPRYEWSGGHGSGEGDVVRHAGRLLPNPWGFYDTCGNSHNWTTTPLPDAKTDPPVYCMPGAAYRYGNAGNGHIGSKFGNYRNCTRHGGYRFALGWRNVQSARIDDAFRRLIQEKRYANFLEGGRYGLTRGTAGKVRPRNGDEGLTDYANITVDGEASNAKACFLKALVLKPGDPAATEGLASAEEFARQYVQETRKAKSP